MSDFFALVFFCFLRCAVAGDKFLIIFFSPLSYNFINGFHMPLLVRNGSATELLTNAKNTLSHTKSGSINFFPPETNRFVVFVCCFVRFSFAIVIFDRGVLEQFYRTLICCGVIAVSNRHFVAHSILRPRANIPTETVCDQFYYWHIFVVTFVDKTDKDLQKKLYSIFAHIDKIK